eukprot:TRINITY_DN2653_c0_g1_i2.p1 TRINITY_DN2653_c0_g1~~TRINITY_DN2653_c0_g1_i2.p1  ORF type:complete len:334 (-),score=99.93 TRINITY_DN2653_c0_g1_i2:105-1106(-)
MSSDKYEVIERLGGGGEGQVYTVHTPGSSDIFVLKKRACMTLDDANSGLDEAYSTAMVRSEYVVRYEKVFLEEFVVSGVKMWHLCILLEYCPRGDLRSFITNPAGLSSSIARHSVDGSMNPQLVKGWIYQLCRGVYALHQSKFVHRDLKCENIFITKNDTIKIGDLGLATRLHGKTNGIAGSTSYMAPEILSNKEYNQKADIWSLGCVIYELVTGKLLSMSGLRRTLGEECISGTFNAGLLFVAIPQEFADVAAVLEHMLVPDPDLRLPIDLILQLDFFRPYLPMRSESSGGLTPTSSSSSLLSNELQLRELQHGWIPQASHVLMRAMLDDPR